MTPRFSQIKLIVLILGLRHVPPASMGGAAGPSAALFFADERDLVRHLILRIYSAVH